MEMKRGKVKSTRHRSQGFIFLISDGIDYFAHSSNMAEGTDFVSLEEGDEVEFIASVSGRGPRAMGVRRLVTIEWPGELK